jgi:superfamily II DNA or RNA helicase
VADEVHTAGQPEFKKFLDLEFNGPRMGLSATPERFGDIDGTERIFRYFGEKLQPFFTIGDAIKAGRLVPYEYEFEEISLTQLEYQEWLDLTKKIGMASAMSEDSSKNKALERLLQLRANVVKEAENKIGYVVKVLRNNFQNGDRWLIYCNNQHQLKLVREALKDFNEKVYDYHIAMPGSKNETLKFFSDNGGIMLAINCLDEGIDIPQINKAIIIASSTNPRQFIQRRGRVLRSFSDKYKAKIWDVLVTSPNGDLLSVSEAKRASVFAQTSESAMTKVKLANLIESANIKELNLEIGDNEN